MMSALRAWSDRLLGRGDAAITIPIFDGVLKPNQWLENAAVVADLPRARDLTSDGRHVYVAAGNEVLKLLDPMGAPASAATNAQAAASPGTQTLFSFERAVTALAAAPDGALAVALDGRDIRIVSGPHAGRSWSAAGGSPERAGAGRAAAMRGVNALAWTPEGDLIATDGSTDCDVEDWCRDLMQLGRTGRLLRLSPATGTCTPIADDLRYAYGAVIPADAASGTATGDAVWVAESWRHRLVECRPGRPPRAVLAGLPGYPSRIVPALGGGYWLTVFACRSQLVEFVLREPAYRQRMLAEVDPRYWIAPALSSGHSYLEPLQGAGVKTMGVIKPWAPPRSYGLLIRLSAQGEPRYSLHSRVDGRHHGITAAAQVDNGLYLLSRGIGGVLRIDVAQIERDLVADTQGAGLQP